MTPAHTDVTTMIGRASNELWHGTLVLAGHLGGDMPPFSPFPHCFVVALSFSHGFSSSSLIPLFHKFILSPQARSSLPHYLLSPSCAGALPSPCFFTAVASFPPMHSPFPLCSINSLLHFYQVFILLREAALPLSVGFSQ